MSVENGLDKAGLDPKFFAWPLEDEPKRAPDLAEFDAGDRQARSMRGRLLAPTKFTATADVPILRRAWSSPTC
jgi:hypothetical protein